MHVYRVRVFFLCKWFDTYIYFVFQYLFDSNARVSRDFICERKFCNCFFVWAFCCRFDEKQQSRRKAQKKTVYCLLAIGGGCSSLKHKMRWLIKIWQLNIEWVQFNFRRIFFFFFFFVLSILFPFFILNLFLCHWFGCYLVYVIRKLKRFALILISLICGINRNGLEVRPMFTVD